MTVPGRAYARLRGESGTMTILTVGVIIVILMVLAVGTAITGVHLERNRLQSTADGAALVASQAYDPQSLYGSGGSEVRVSERDARAAAEAYLAAYPVSSARTRDVRIEQVDVGADGTVRVVLAAQTDPPLIGWVTRIGWVSVGISATGSARSR